MPRRWRRGGTGAALVEVLVAATIVCVLAALAYRHLSLRQTAVDTSERLAETHALVEQHAAAEVVGQGATGDSILREAPGLGGTDRPRTKREQANEVRAESEASELPAWCRLLLRWGVLGPHQTPLTERCRPSEAAPR